jgi:demethylmenaquinone methyltransferase/2-methoxy-6-polyprenyl-1,4-benzoquinol methylase
VTLQPRHSLPGTQPPGTSDEVAAARYVRALFDGVAGKYDFLNHLLSANVDRYWRRAVAREFRQILRRPDARVLDLCCGTGDLGVTLSRHGSASIVSSDFSHPMVVLAREKLLRKGPPATSSTPLLAEADALRMPFADQSFDLVTCAFGFRNLANYTAGLEQIRRVLRRDGEVGILEFAEPEVPLIAPLYSVYFHRILPAIGEWLTGVNGAYRYLASSVDRFPGRREFLQMMQSSGFTNVRKRELTGGIAVLYIGEKG